MKSKHRLVQWVVLSILSFGAASRADPPVYRFVPSGQDGGGAANGISVNPFQPGQVILGGDVYGFWRSDNYGADFRPVSVRNPADKLGAFANERDLHILCVEYSSKVEGRVYGFGASAGFLVSEDNGETWRVASNELFFSGSNASGPRGGMHPRCVGQLIVLDKNGDGEERIYVGTHAKPGGPVACVARSTDVGATWARIAIPNANMSTYICGLALDDQDPTRLYVAIHDADRDAINKPVFQIIHADQDRPEVRLLSAPFADAEEVVVVKGRAYVAAGKAGVFRYDAAKNTWANLFNDNGGSLFYSIDGYYDAAGRQTIVYAGTADHPQAEGAGLYRSIIRIKDPDSGPSSWQSMTADPKRLHVKMNLGGPNGTGDHTDRIWWHSEEMGPLLGGMQYEAERIVVDPTRPERVYVCGRAGAWRTDDAYTPKGGAEDGPAWYPIVHRVGATQTFRIQADPNVPGRAYCAENDWHFVYSNDSFEHVTAVNPGNLGGREDVEYALAVDSATTPATVYMGRSSSLIYISDPERGAWADTGLGKVGKGLVRGCAVKTIGAETILLAAVDDAANRGLWRKVGAGDRGAWSKVCASNNIMNRLNPRNVSVEFGWGGGASRLVYFTDKKNGVFRSTDGGLTWAVVDCPIRWDADLRGIYSGAIAIAPADENVCYITSTNGVWRSTNAAAAAPTFSPAQGIPNWGTSLPGQIVFDDTGNLYLLTVCDIDNPAKLYYLARGETAWRELAVDNVFRAMCGFVSQLSVGPASDGHKLYLSIDHMGVCVGLPANAPAVQAAQAASLRGN